MGQIIDSSPWLRRLAWRVGRSLYCLARGEQRIDDIRLDGELELQQQVVRANRNTSHFVVFDIGANQGDWTLALIDACNLLDVSEGRVEVHAFEPVPSTSKRLAARMKSAAIQGIQINTVGVSDRDGDCDIALMSETGGTNTLVYDATDVQRALDVLSVPVVSLDSYCSVKNVDHVHLVKCDTEGHDLAVIRGAIELLKSGRIDVFQFEYNQRWIVARSFLKDVFGVIDGLPYRLGRVMPRRVELFNTWHPELERFYQSNYVLIRDGVDGICTVEGLFDTSNIYKNA